MFLGDAVICFEQEHAFLSVTLRCVLLAESERAHARAVAMDNPIHHDVEDASPCDLSAGGHDSIL